MLKYALLFLICLPIVSGCAAGNGVEFREAPRNVLAETLNLMSSDGPKPTDRTRQVLRRYDLEDKLDKHQFGPLLTELQELHAREPSPELVYSIAEIAYVEGKRLEKTDKKLAQDLFGVSVAHSYLYLFDERFNDTRNPYDPEFRRASDLYNQALESSLRYLKKQNLLRPGCKHTIQIANNSIDVVVKFRGNTWRPEDLNEFKFASDYQIKGLTNHYRTYGLGVPMIAIRKKQENRLGATEKYFPEDISFPVTMFLRLVSQKSGSGAGQGRVTAELEIYDTLESADVMVKNRLVPLESDLSTPLAYFLNNPHFQDNKLATSGLLNPNNKNVPKGIFMQQPYQPGKIPVLMVHGLWSSPITWMQMFNDLRSDPELRDKYQFWFYLYPTGQPFWHSAAQLREDLAELRKVVDPAHREPALDEMVLVGHSMGGLVARLQTIDSKDNYWNVVSKKPFDVIKASYQAQKEIARPLYFQANPSIKRVITIGTPHGGSYFANSWTRWFASKFIKPPKRIRNIFKEVRRDNPEAFAAHSLLDTPNSLDSLSPKSPIFRVMYQSSKPRWVTYHNVIGVLPKDTWLGKISKKGDGVVHYASAHREDVASEIEVPADHSAIHSHPRAVREVRRILKEHLQAISQTSNYDGMTLPYTTDQNFAPAKLQSR